MLFRQLSRWAKLLICVLGIGVCAVALQACNTRGGVVPYDRADFGQPDITPPEVPNNNRIAKLDTVTVAVYQLPDVSRDVQVDGNGDITLPLVGTLRAEGKTTQELAKVIATSLAASYVRAPDVQVSIKQTIGQLITVEGSVQTPGAYPVIGQTSLIKAIAQARGTTDAANPRRVIVFRMINGQRNAAAFDLTAIRRAQAGDPPIYGNDIIVVDGSDSRSMFKDVVTTIPLLALFHPF